MRLMLVSVLLSGLFSSIAGAQSALQPAAPQTIETCILLTLQYSPSPPRLLLQKDLGLYVALTGTGLSLQTDSQEALVPLFSGQSWALAELSLFGNGTLILCQEEICIRATISQGIHRNAAFTLGKEVKARFEDCPQSLLTQNSQVEIPLTNNLRFDYPLTAGISVSYGLVPGGSYPDIRLFDPIPTQDRGIYYDGNYSGVFWLNGVGNLLGGSGLTIEMWVFHRSSGTLFNLYYLLNNQIQPLISLAIKPTDIRSEGEFILIVRTTPKALHYIYTGYIFKSYKRWVHVGVS